MEQPSGAIQYLRFVSAVNNTKAWAAGDNGTMLMTDGGGSSAAWYLAEGLTGGGFEIWVLVQNPGREAAVVDLI